MEIVELKQLHATWNIFTEVNCSRRENCLFIFFLKNIAIIVPLAEFRNLYQYSGGLNFLLLVCFYVWLVGLVFGFFFWCLLFLFVCFFLE